MNSALVTREKFINSYENKKLGEFAANKKTHIIPLHASQELAGIIGDLFSDGHIGSNMIIFSSNDVTSLRDFGKRMKKVFGASYKIRPVVTNTYGVKSLYVFDNGLVRILNLCGVPVGNKALQKYSIPNWIKNNETYMRNFLRHLYDCDGCVVRDKRVKIKIMAQKDEKLCEDNREFLESIRTFLTKNKIKSTNIYKTGYYTRKDGIKTIGFGFEIQGTSKNLKSASNFQSFIGFNNKIKKKKLEDFIKNASRAPL